MTFDLDAKVWGEIARMCWTQMALYPRGTANWDMANDVLHALAARQIQVFDYKPKEGSSRPLSPG